MANEPASRLSLVGCHLLDATVRNMVEINDCSCEFIVGAMTFATSVVVLPVSVCWVFELKNSKSTESVEAILLGNIRK